MSRRLLLAATAASAALLCANAALAASAAYTAPNLISTVGPTAVSLGGATFVNQGLVGTARLPATLRDFNGETLGSFSGLAIDLKTWRRGADGTYTTGLYTLPDRGPNNIGGLTTTDYAARLNRFTASFVPNAGAAAVPATTQQMQLAQDGGFLLRDATGQVFSGRDPLNGTVVRDGVTYPIVPAGSGPGAGKLALDAEAVTFLPDGSFYVGDEYGAEILYFDANGRQLGAIQANPDLLPRVNGQINFNGTNDAPLVPGTTGRRSNQGMEGVSVSPDGSRLIAVLQSATLQDNPTNVAARRNNTRVLVYDISANRTPTAPVAEYVLQLPVYNNSLTGTGAATATAAQSEVLALNTSQFLVLSRDGNGRGTNGNANAIAFKSVLLVDLDGATNIAGTAYSNGTTPISTTANANGSGDLVPGIVPVQQVELVNMLNTAQLGRFGINTNPAPSAQYTLSEKWEAMGLAPALEEDRPQDFFLLVGNDNDFVSSNINAAGVSGADTSLTSPTAGVGNNDNVILIYRLTLPTYVDPQALASLKATAPLLLTGGRQVSLAIGGAAAASAMETLSANRRTGAARAGLRVWADGDWARVEASARGVDFSADGAGAAIGADIGWRRARFGAALAYQTLDGDFGPGFDIKADGYSLALYGGVGGDTGFWAQAAVGGTTGLSLDKIRRPGAYGQMAMGSTDASVWTGQAQVGWAAPVGGWRIGPYLGLGYSRAKVDGYAEHNASVSNVTVAGYKADQTSVTFGFEAAGRWGSVTPSARLAYSGVHDNDEATSVRLTSAQHALASQRITPLPVRGDYATAAVGLAGQAAGFGWRAAAEGRFSARNDVSARVSVGLSKAF